MSEYQFIDFRAVDGPVSEDNLDFMCEQSSRAEIDEWRFVNEYNFGDFHGDAEEMLRRGYDAHLHYANFGIRKLVFRLPQGLPCDKRTFNKYAVSDNVAWTKDKRGTGGLLTIEPESDAGTYEDDIDAAGLLDRLLPLREMLIGGDLRPLFLAWLAFSYDDDEKLPPVPAGLNEMTAALQALAEFYEIPVALIQAAAAESSPAPRVADQKKLVRDWAAKQSRVALEKSVAELLVKNSAAARAKIMAEIRGDAGSTSWPTTSSAATLGELRSTAKV
jgi:hypothetical protein